MSTTDPSDPKSLPWLVFDRQVRPGALWLMVFTTYASAAGILGRSLQPAPWPDLTGIVGLLAAGALAAGWWARSTAAMSAGLLTCCWLWATIAAAVVSATGTIWSVSAWSAGCWAGLAGLLWLRDRRET